MTLMKNKIVLITGASSGIGKACAETFAAEGASLILTARRTEKLNTLAEDLKAKYQTNVLTITLDVRNQNKVKDAFDKLPLEWKNVDILINNAGLARGLSKIHEGDIQHWEEMIDTNVKGLLYVTRSILPNMTARESGHVINIGSIAGHEVYPMGNVYCATKFAVNALTQAIRMDTLDKGIKVTTVDPGMVTTEFSYVRFSGDREKAKNVYNGLQPLTPEDIAETVLFCASRPAHVNINEIIVMPTAQACATQVIRK